VIVFSAFLVVVAVGLLVAGVVTSKLWLVYVAIGVSGVSLLALGLGAILKRDELFGKAKEAELSQRPPVPAQVASPQPASQGLPQSAAAPAGYDRTVAAHPGPPQAGGYLPSDQPPRISPPAVHPPPAASAAGPTTPSPPPGVWEWRDTPPPVAPPAPAVPPAEPEAPTAALARAGLPDDRPTPDEQPGAQAEQPAGDQPPQEDQLPTEHAPADHEQPTGEGQPTGESQQPTPPAGEEAGEEGARDEAPRDEATEGQQQAARQQEPEAPQPAQDEQDEQDEQATAGEQEPPVGEPQAGDAAQADRGAEADHAEVDLLRQVTVVPGVPRYHTAQCILIRFMGEDDLNKMTLGEARQAGCTPCRACQPDEVTPG
jgi:hypothetical protein